jgi:hypothetical protein
MTRNEELLAKRTKVFELMFTRHLLPTTAQSDT